MSEHNYDTSEYIKLTNGVKLIKVEEYEKLKAENEDLYRKLEICKAGLKFYASVSHWSDDNPTFDMRDDCGDVARQALKEIEEK